MPRKRRKVFQNRQDVLNIEEFDFKSTDDLQYAYFEIKFVSSSVPKFKIFSSKFQIFDFTCPPNNLLESNFFLVINSKKEWYLLQTKPNFIYKLSIDVQFNYMNFIHFCKSINPKLCLIEGNFSKSPENSWNLVFNIFFLNYIIYSDYKRFMENYLFKNDQILAIMSFLFDFQFYLDRDCQQEFLDNNDIENFYGSIINEQKNYDRNYESIELCYENLKPKLWKHQELAVKWMLHREKGGSKFDTSSLFIKYQFENLELFYHKSLGHFITQDVYLQYLAELSLNRTFGGILADEMGLGKTVDVITLILNNKPNEFSNDKYSFFTRDRLFSLSKDPLQGELKCYCGIQPQLVLETISIKQLFDICLEQKYFLNDNLIKCLSCSNYQHLKCSSYSFDDFPYICCRCWLKVELIDSPATLIVCPNSILPQWLNELERHVISGLKIFQYNGVKSKEYISPPLLANNDIVITSYEILRSELDYQSAYNYGHLRNSKRYYSPMSPLGSIKWWRLCFDEAQLVEGKLTKLIKMATSLHSIHRWAVTGTPIQTNLEDLFGLVHFIREEPFCHQTIWRSELYNPFCNGHSDPLIDAMGKCFWRTSKNTIFNEINLSEPKFITEQFDFCQIERDFYSQIASSCQISIYENLRNFSNDSKISELSNSVQSVLFNLALKLRQICCHPICSNIFKQTESYSLQDVLNKMIEETKYDCEKNHREMIAAMNGIAAIYIEQGNLKDAITIYKNGLQSINNSEDIRTDKTQQYHIYYNLAQIMDHVGCVQVNVENVPYSDFDRIQKIKIPKEEINIIDLNINNDEDKFFRLKAEQVYINFLNVAKLSCVTTDKYRLELIKKCDAFKEKFKFNDQWSTYAIEKLSFILNPNELINTLSMILSPEIEVASLDYFKIKFINYMKSFENVRQKLLTVFEHLNYESVDMNAQKYIKCHVKATPPKRTCYLCKAELIIQESEKIIFKVNQLNEINNNSNDDKPSWETNYSENNYLLALRKVGLLFKAKGSLATDYEPMVEEIDNFFSYIEECKKEHKTHRKLWVESCEFVLRIDEMSQARSRYDDLQFKQFSIEALLERDACTKSLAQDKLKTNRERLKYLSNLKLTLKDKDNVESRMCSVCWSDLERYAVLRCGHILCTDCVYNINKYSDMVMKCPVCRSTFEQAKVIYVNSNQSSSEQISVKGDWSTKIVRIIQSIKRIIDSTEEKILVFSTWTRMLDIMEIALKTNDIQSILINGSDKSFYAKINHFKKSASCKILLLPLKFACKGLNLTEASRVVFINPVLNKRDELQAIGRINRIGQLKQTYVHKFIIKDTIEELIENHNQDFNRRSLNSNEFASLSVGEFCALFKIYGC